MTVRFATVTNAPHCPRCSAELAHQAGDFAAWLCPNAHGLAATLAVLRQKVDDKEVGRIWTQSTGAADGTTACPFCTKPMARITLAWDHAAPPAAAATPGADPPTPPGPAAPIEGPRSGTVEVDVCRVDQVIWLDAGELEALPPQAHPAPPSTAPIIVNPWADAADRLGYRSQPITSFHVWGGGLAQKISEAIEAHL